MDKPSAATPQPTRERPELGVRLAFDPIFDTEGDTNGYQLYLLNSTPNRILYELKISTGSQAQGRKFGPLEPHGQLRYPQLLPYGYLNERLTVEVDVRAVVEGGTGPRHFQQLRVKPKTFFSSLQPVAELRHDAHLFTLFPTVDVASVSERQAPSTPSLRELTKRQLKQAPATAAAAAKPRLNSAAARAEFNTVLDLHLDALVAEPDSVPKKDILKIQLEHFEAFVDQALRLDVERVLIVHGLGNGILKTEIHARLPSVPFVKHFRNEYHPKYGYGATEVEFE